MTPKPAALAETATCAEAARVMRDRDVGAVLVLRQTGGVAGIITDRDITIRCVAIGANPERAVLGSICTHGVEDIGPDSDVGDAVDLMKRKAIRRVPVMKDGQAVGILSMGDLAAELDPTSALGKVSAAPPNH